MDGTAAERSLDRLIEYGIRPCAVAGFFVLVAFLWTLLLQHLVAYPFVFLFLVGVMGSAWFGGRIAGAISVVASTAVVDYFFVPPFYSFAVNPIAQSYCISFVLCAALMSGVSASRKRSEMIVRDARDLLEQRVMERTAELRQSMTEIVESEHRLQTLTEVIPQQIWSAGVNGLVEHCNQHLLEYTGAQDLTKEKLFHRFHPVDEGEFRQLWKQCRISGEKLEGEWRVLGADGNYRWFLIRSVPQRAANGEIERWYGTHIDIEERRRAEQALLEAQAELSDLSHRLSMGELAASIAHELGQPLTAVTTNAYACREWLNAKPANLERAARTAEMIVQESKRASDVVARVRALFRKEMDSRSMVNLNRLIHDVVRLVHDDAIRRKVTVVVELEPKLLAVAADPIQIQQVLMNLVTNGMDAMMGHGDRKELIIRSRNTGSAEVQVEVLDCGAGIEPEMARRMFDPFFTTKAHGIGMGLAISHNIIEAHEGRLWFTPRASGGSSFHFAIPVLQP